MVTADSELVARAKARSEIAHAGATRDNGTPYATHPHAVACILIERGHTEPAVLAAAYLHDVLEDTDTPREHLLSEFGSDVVDLVDQLTNIGPPDRTFEEKQAALLDHARKMSPRAKLVKLADRLQNMSEMGVWPAWKQQRYARAALELVDALEPIPDEVFAEEVRSAATAWL